MSAPQKIIDLVEDFEENKHEYTNPEVFDEENTKVKFLNPFFEELGWNVRNEGLSARFREVVFEDSIKVGKKTKAPDYSFRLGGERIFFVEAKKPSRDIANDKEHAFQVRRYGWSAKLPLCILTDFQELAIYDTTIKPDKSQSASIGRIKYYKYTDYIDKWEEIYNIFSKEAVLSGKFDSYANNVKQDKKGTTEIDDEFLKEIEQWRLLLARNIALRNPELSIEDLNYAVQLTIDRIIFLRIAEDRGIERYGQLEKLLQKENIYKEFGKICKKADEKYNSGLFHFNPYDKEDFTTDTYTLDLTIDNNVFKEIFKNLYYPNSPYEFSLISTEILGKIYEQFLGDVIRLTPSHQAKVETKPEVKKAGGVYYTPQYIVDYIVENTLGDKIKDKTPNQISKIRVIDPACGSGSFLIRAYQYLLDYHLDYYSKLEKPPKDVIYEDKKGLKHLSIKEKKRILKNNIYGVDLDTLAVEVTKLSLLLKVLEDQNKDLLESQQKLFHERVLPNLSSNIKNGNSLIGSDILDQQELSMEEVKEIKPFDYETEFPEVFEQGGFDVVIGNPPYVKADLQEENYQKQRKWMKNSENYETLYERWDLYIAFIEKGLKILKNQGYLSLIISNSYNTSKSSQLSKEFIMNNYHLKQIDFFKNMSVFKGVGVESLILTVQNNKNEEYPIRILHDTEFGNITLLKSTTDLDKLFRPEIVFEFKKLENYDLLGDICYVSYGLRPNANEKIAKGEFGKNDLISDIQTEINSKEYVEGKYIKAYQINSIKYLEWNTSRVPSKIARPTFPELYEHPKIIRGTTTGAIYDDKQIICNHSCSVLVPYISLNGVENKSIKGSIKKWTSKTREELELISAGYDLYYILAILNSNMSYAYLNSIRKHRIKNYFYPDDLKKLPIKKIDLKKQKQLGGYAKKITELKQQFTTSNTPSERKLLQQQIDVTDKQINQKVYELYDLTDEEIRIIESNLN